MNQPLRPEVITAKSQRRSVRLNVALAATAAAIGGAVGTGAVVLSVLPFINNAPAPAPMPTMALSEPLPAPVQIAPPIIRPLELAAEKPAVGRPAFILHAEAPRFVLAPEIKDEWLVKGAPEMVWEDNSTYVLERGVNPRVLPSTFTSLIGRRAALFDDEGGRCVATVGELSSTLKVVEDFQDKPDTASDRADAWGYGEPALVARVESIEGECEGTLVAAVIVDAETAPERISRAAVKILDAKSALAHAANKAFTSTPEYTATQAEFSKDGAGNWHGAEDVPVTLVGDATRGVAFISTSVGGCGEFEASLTAAYEVRDGVLGSRIAVPSDTMVADLVAAADANGDGVPELFISRWFFNTAVWSSSPAGFASTPGAEVVAHICPC